MVAIREVEEQRIVLRNVTWGTDERLLAERGENRVPRFTFDRGVLEIMSPLSADHEESSDNISFLVRIIAREIRLNIRSFRSMILRREDVQGGLEPDNCFYVQTAPLIRGRRNLDMGTDPPPDLVVEVDVTNPAVRKLSIYARLGVPEVWRYDGREVEIHLLAEGGYARSAESRALPGVTDAALTQWITRSRTTDSIEWEDQVRQWARELSDSGVV